MELIIHVEKDYYEQIKYNVEHGQKYKPFDIIANGIPLPKGHGDLIDRDIAIADFNKACFSYEGGLLKYVPTVIPRDKEKTNELL